jgi:hypothetical protein
MAIDPADQLDIYNGALLMLGSRKLASLSEEVESRRVLDQIWDNNGVKRTLQHGWWKHAMRTVQITYDPDFTASFGFTYSFDIPTDLVRLYSLCSDEFYTTPLNVYQDDGSRWYCDLQEIYVRYVSDGDDYGMDCSKWPESFREYVEGYFALKAVKRITDAKVDADDLKEEVRKLKVRAKSEDALREATGWTVPTGWQVARQRYGNNSRYKNHPYR